MKLVTFYLPQFHEIPENNDAWGKGFTEWTNVKKSKPLFVGHNQPRVPLQNNYYNLLDENTIKWQAKLSHDAGIYGFCFYHYWFMGRLVLEKPIDILYSNKEIDLKYCMCWANEPWTKTWHGAGGNREILIPQDYGTEEEWELHYNYFQKYFKDTRYIKENNCPVLVIYRLRNIPNYNSMIRFWNQRAIEDGFSGIFIVSMNVCREHVEMSRWVNATVDFEPNKTKSELHKKANKFKPQKSSVLWNRFAMKRISYDELNKKMLSAVHKKNHFRTVFVDYDDSPRRGERAIIIRGATPKKFGKYLRATIDKSKNEGNEYIFINAWNEWGEGNYLEPDKRHRSAYLDQVKKCSIFQTISVEK